MNQALRFAFPKYPGEVMIARHELGATVELKGCAQLRDRTLSLAARDFKRLARGAGKKVTLRGDERAQFTATSYTSEGQLTLELYRDNALVFCSPVSGRAAR